MTTLLTSTDAARTTPPYSRLVQVTVAGALVLAGLLNGGLQYATHLAAGDLDRAEYIAWGMAHPGLYRTEQFGLMVSAPLLLLGFLGLAHLTRWTAPRLTLVATILTVWGMWGFGNVLATGYAAQVVAADTLGVDAAVRLIEAGYLADGGITAGALVPHLVGSFLGLLLLALACWRSGRLPRVPVVLLVAFLVWDFLLPPVGPLEAHLLLAAALVWLGIAVGRLPHSRWLRGNA